MPKYVAMDIYSLHFTYIKSTDNSAYLTGSSQKNDHGHAQLDQYLITFWSLHVLCFLCAIMLAGDAILESNIVLLATHSSIIRVGRNSVKNVIIKFRYIDYLV